MGMGDPWEPEPTPKVCFGKETIEVCTSKPVASHYCPKAEGEKAAANKQANKPESSTYAAREEEEKLQHLWAA